MIGEQALQLLETAVKFSETHAADIIDQFLNYMIFMNVMSGLRSIAIIFIGWLLLKAIGVVVKVFREEKKILAVAIWDFMRVIVIVATTAITIWIAYQPMLTVAKILIAPKVYLLEEGAEFITKHGKK